MIQIRYVPGALHRKLEIRAFWSTSRGGGRRR